MRALSVLLLAGLGACTTRPNPVVCCDSPADCNSIGVTDPMRTCQGNFVCIDHECGSPTTGCMMDTDCPAATPACDTATQTCVGCLMSDQCTSTAPICDTMSQTCVGCLTSDQCSGMTPVCDTANDTCVGCLTSDQCPSTAPTCDTTTNTCVQCATDADCASAVCDLDAGTCVATGNILYASPTGGAAAACTQAAPCSIAHAFALVSTTFSTVKLGAGSYTANLTIVGQTVLVDGFGATVNAGEGARAWEINDGANVRLVGLSIVDLNSGINGTAVSCETEAAGAVTPIVELDQVSVDATFTTIDALPCLYTIRRSQLHERTSDSFTIVVDTGTTATIDRTVIDGGDGVLLANAGSTVHITNSVISNQTGADGAFTSGASLVISFSTIINSVVKCGNGVPPCQTGTAVGECIDNSIILNGSVGAPADTVTGSACVANYTLVFPQTSAVSGANNKLAVDPLLANPAGADYHLQPASPAIDAADPAAIGTPDFDGVARPQGPRSDMGAFEYKP